MECSRGFVVLTIGMVVFSSISVCIASTEDVVVDTPVGKIRGVKDVDQSTRELYLTFKGIPFAKPPIGQLRLAKPQPHPPFDGVFDATSNAWIGCPVPDNYLTNIDWEGFEPREDCLILNIFKKTTNSESNALKKVIVFIHGGAFVIGTSSLYDPKSFVMNQDVIMVTINYRLGVMGFFSTENEASPGNYGLWDQLLALKWVKDNIRAFGGDPDDVTLSGESAGGISTGLLSISPYSKGLFTKAYPMSGAASSTFARAVNAQSHSLVMAKLAGCWDKDTTQKISLEESNAVVDCLRKAPLSAFTSFAGYSISEAVFVPSVDGDVVKDIPEKLLKDKDFLTSIGFFERTYLVGVNNLEKALFDVVLAGVKYVVFSSNETTTEEKDATWQYIIEATKKFGSASRFEGHGEESIDILNTEINKFYSRRLPDDTSVLSEIMADYNFLLASLDFARAASLESSCQMYYLYFDYFPEYMKGSFRGTAHGMDLAYWFDAEVSDIEKILRVGVHGNFTEEDKQLKTAFSTLIGDFIKYGNPGQTLNKHLPSPWPRFNADQSSFLNFNPSPWVGTSFQKEKQEFWYRTLPRLVEKKKIVHSEL